MRLYSFLFLYIDLHNLGLAAVSTTVAGITLWLVLDASSSVVLSATSRSLVSDLATNLLGLNDNGT